MTCVLIDELSCSVCIVHSYPLILSFLTHTAFHNPILCTQLTNTKHICASGGKMAQDVGMVWQCCGVIPI